MITSSEETDLLKMNGFDDCIVGVVERYGQSPILCYDKEKVLLQLQRESGMTEEEAREFFYYNQIGACMGEATPCFLSSND